MINTKNILIPNIVILVLLAFCLVFGWMVLFRGDSGYKEKLKQLEAANVQLQEQRTSINVKIDSLQCEYTKLKAHDVALAADVVQRDASIAKTKAEAALSQAELTKLKREMEETIRKIKEAKDRPANRTGDDLINSLKLKTSKQ